ncbi:MAG: hypothetical protein HZA51_16530 [Planctomycetes bacterium]|nr:hypothetical protein [Planctomycetota bacterium]
MPRHNQFKRRRAYILVVILGFAAIATSLGLAFLDANSTVMPEAVNYLGAMRAGYVAGSGVVTAAHYLIYPPTTVPYGQYLTSMSGVSPDGSTDYFDVSVQRSDAWTPPKTDPNLYRITALGVATDGDGTPRAKKSITAEVIVPATGKWNIPYATLSRGNLAIAAIQKVYGDAHANANLSGPGYCNGKLSASGTCLWSGTGPPTSITSLAPTVSPIPAANPALYASYTIQGKTYTGYTGFTANTITASDAAALNAIDMSATNPGRILIAQSGNLRVRAGVNLNGTLVVDGRLELDDSSTIQINAVQYFPSVVVSSDLKVLSNDSTITLNGPVILGGRIDMNSKDRVTISITGPSIVQQGVANTKTTDSLICTYSANRALFWDIENAPTPQPMTVLSWKEN